MFKILSNAQFSRKIFSASILAFLQSFGSIPLLAMDSLVRSSEKAELMFELPRKECRGFRPPSPIEDLDTVLDQVIGLEESRLALAQDVAEKLKEDSHTISLIKLALLKTPLSKLSKDLAGKLKQLYTDYSTEDFYHLDTVVSKNASSINLKSVEEKRKNLQKTKFFLGRDKMYPWSFNPVVLFKNFLVERLNLERDIQPLVKKYEETKGEEGVPYTLPERFQQLNDREKWQVQFLVDQMATYDQQLLLLYDLLPLEIIQNELRDYLSIPSLWLYLQGYQRSGRGEGLAPIDADVINSSYIIKQGLTPFTPCEAIELDGAEYLNYLMGTEAYENLDNDFERPIEQIVQDRKKSRDKEKKKKQKLNKKQKEDNGVKLPQSEALVVQVESSLSNLSLEKELDKSCGFEELLPPIEHPKPGEPSGRARYKPNLPAGQKRQERIARMIEEGKDACSAQSTKASMSLLSKITLKNEAAEAYSTLFKIGNQKRILKWKAFEMLFVTALKGEILKNGGNGASRTLNFTMKGTHGSVIESRRFIHEPHSMLGSTFGYESLALLREHFTFWGLAPEQGNVVLQLD